MLEVRPQFAAFTQLIGGVGVALLDLRSERLVSVNPAFCRITGQTPEALLAGPYWDLTHPDDRAGSRLAVQQAIEGGADEFVITKRYQRAGGPTAWVRVYLTILRDETGQAVQAVKVVEDITKEREASLALAQSERRQAVAVESCHLAIWDWNLLDDSCYLSDGIGRQLGREPESLTPYIDTLRHLIHPEDLPRVQAALEVHFRERTAYDVTFRMRRGDGTFAWIQDRGRATLDAEGRAVRMTGSHTDVTAQVRAEEELRQTWAALEDRVRERTAQLEREVEARRRVEAELWASEQRLWLALDSAREGFFDLNLGMGEHYLSPGTVRLLGPDPGDFPLLSGRRVHPDDRARLQQAVTAHLLGETPQLSIRFRAFGPDQTCHWLHIRGRAVSRDGKGRAIQMAGTVVDVTGEETLRQQLEQAMARAESANEAKGAFLASMSHEMRTPLNGVLGLLDLLADSPLNQEQRDLTQTIATSARSLLDVINDILDYSKIEAGKMVIERIPFALRETIEGALDVVSTRAAEKSLELVADLPADLPVRILGDPVRLRQVLLNLLSNAIKFTRTGHVIVQVAEEGPQLVVTVSDTGIGIPDSALAHLFTPFMQVDASITRKFGGTGLGLAITKELVERMSGAISVKGQLGVGSSFRIALPLEVVERPGGYVQAREEVMVTMSGLASVEASVRSWCVAHGLRYTAYVDLTSPGTRFLLVDIDRCEPETFTTWLDLSRSEGITLITVGALRNRHRFTALAGGAALPFLVKPIRYQKFLQVLGLSAAAVIDTAPAAEAAASTSRSADRVLVVEDNIVNQRVALGLLAKLGVAADLAEDGVQALRILEEKDYDVVLMDCQMPRMDGFQASREIREREKGNRRKAIIALTAGAFLADQQRAREAGMDDFLTKPIDLNKLAQALDRWSPHRSPAAAPSLDAAEELVPAPAVVGGSFAGLRYR